MNITSTTTDGAVVVTLTGDIDGKTAASTQESILPLIPEGGRLLLDMSGVGYMSSAGLRMLLLLYRQTQARGSSVALAGLSEEIRETMSATGFLDYFVTSTTVSEGLAALRT